MPGAQGTSSNYPRELAPRIKPRMAPSQTDADHEESPDVQEICLSCKQDHKKCVSQPPEARCDRCFSLGYTCSLGDEDTETTGKRRKLSKYKCDFCRQRKQKCLPEIRSWPGQKCVRCDKLGLPCSEPRASSKKKHQRGSVTLWKELFDGSENEYPQANRTRRASDSRAIVASNGIFPGSYSTRTVAGSPFREIVSITQDMVQVMGSADGTSTFRPPPTRARRTGMQKREPTHFSDVVSTVVQTRNEYQYSLIGENEIRLLLLQPGEANVRIECALVTAREDEAVYEALSYVWGAGSPSYEIGIQGAKYFIRQNLHSALRHLRDRKTQVVLWVDALCINQQDMREKSIQIRKMAKIYNRASNVCVWLGESSPSSTTAFELIPEILDLSQFSTMIRDEKTSNRWKALVELMQRPWFSRLWVIQDVAAARNATVHCGTQVVHWADFADAVAVLQVAKGAIKSTSKGFDYDLDFPSSTDRPEMRASILVETGQNLFRKSDDGSIIDCITDPENLATTLAAFDASDARDHVYACLSMAAPSTWFPDSDSSDIHLPKIDYGKSVAEVFQNLVEFCVRSSYSLDIICRRWVPPMRQRSAEGLPSWILPWTPSSIGGKGSPESGRVNADSFVGSPGQLAYRASRLTRPVATFGTGSNTYDGSLSVKGFRLDRISALGPRNVDGLIMSESLRMGDWLPDEDSNLPSVVPEKLWRTLVADRGRGGISNPPGWYHRACLHCLNYASRTGDVSTNELITSGQPSLLVDFLERVQSVIWNRKFLIKKCDNLLGLAPSNAQEGDLVCVLFGCSVPVVLRERKPEQGHQPVYALAYSTRESSTNIAWDPFTSLWPPPPPNPGSQHDFEFIGECYIHGMMEGEAFDDDIATIERSSEVFKLV